jgi:hypothetical protein
VKQWFSADAAAPAKSAAASTKAVAPAAAPAPAPRAPSPSTAAPAAAASARAAKPSSSNTNNVAAAPGAQVIAGLIFPVYKNFGFSLGAQDNYINNPPSGYKSNTFQFTGGLNYTFK